MAISTIIDSETELRTHVITGELTPEDLIATFEEAFSRDDFQVGSHALWDFRGATGKDLLAGNVRSLVDAVVKHRSGDEGTRIAVVVARNLDFGLARMYQQMLEASTEVKVMVFRDRDEAEIWAKGGGEE